MNLKYFLLLSLFCFATQSFAIDTVRCPKAFSFQAKVERVYKSSIYSETPGWKEAQAILNENEGFESNFYLESNEDGVCVLEDRDGNVARLHTAEFHDPEEREPHLVDQIYVRYKIKDSTFVTYVPIKSYSRTHIEPFSKPYKVKVKTLLLSEKAKRLVNFDIGTILVVIESH